MLRWIRGREARPAREDVGTDSPALDDRELVSAISQRDEQAFRLLYRRYGGVTYALVMRIVDDEECAEEVVQDAFLRVWRHAADYRSDQSGLATWILNIARNLAVDELRRRRARPTTYDPLKTGEHVEDEQSDPDPRGDPQVVAELADVRVAVRAALETLPGVQRAAIELAYFRGLTQSEIAQVTGLPLGTIKSRIRFGMRALQSALAARGYGPTQPQPGSTDG
ncbi:MAG TPA: sigma-70 family RNA polymerase sigma factor [Chloroflexota bacterium]|nr:sigma-70 family RNA polymerase sigma factor [Chloroflexota bacterium]